MVNESEKTRKTVLNKSKQSSGNQRKSIETSSIIALFILIAAVLMISLNLRLIAGFLVISATALGIVIVRKSWNILKNCQESMVEFSSLNTRKDDVIVDFSHRIREPLNNLVVISEMLMESGLQKKQKDLLETFMASTNNMVSTLNELTMQSAGNLTYEYRKAIKFNLYSTVQNTIELYNLKDQANIDFILNKKENSDFECYGDPIILKQILLDLFNNVEIQTTDRETKVAITLKKIKESNTQSNIDIRIQTDNPINLVNDNATDKSLAVKFIHAGNGKYTQEVGANSTVLNIFLPFLNPVSDSKHSASPQKVEVPVKDKIHKKLKDIKILLVEDNIINQKIMIITLQQMVHSIDTASNGKEAVDKFANGSFDLILMDVQMPVMSGLAAAEKIRSLETSSNSHVPIIAITANAMLGDKEKCLSAGMDDYISKPYQPSALIEKIKQVTQEFYSAT